MKEKGLAGRSHYDRERSTVNWSATYVAIHIVLLNYVVCPLLTVVSISCATLHIVAMELEWAVQSLAYYSAIVSCHGASWYKAAQLGGRCNLIPGVYK